MRSKLKRGLQKLKKKPPDRKLGLAPGSLVATGLPKDNPATIRMISYTSGQTQDRVMATPQTCLDYIQTHPEEVHWIDINGTHDVALVETLGQGLNIHPLTQEDILNPGQRTKLETMGHQIFITPKMFSLHEQEVREEAISVILGPHWVLTFQEVDKPGDVWNPVRERLKNPGSHFHKYKTPDYLLYALLDTIVDQYFVILDFFEERTDELEQSILTDLRDDSLVEVQQLKGQMIRLRKSVWPLRDIISQLEKSDFELIDMEKTSIYFRDVHDHLSSIIENLEVLREILTNIINLHISLLSHQMNHIMKTLAMISTVFIPLTFLTGLYGMNFKHMPELNWTYGYGMALTLMAISVLCVFWLFKRKDWI